MTISITFTYDKSRRLTNDTNLSTDEKHTYTWNQRNMLTGITNVKAGGGDAARSFTYNALGERVVAVDNASSQPAYWSYDGKKFLRDKEKVGAGFSAKNYRHNDTGQLCLGSLVKTVLADGTALNPAQDGNGSVQNVGTGADSFVYSWFGDEIISSNNQGTRLHEFPNSGVAKARTTIPIELIFGGGIRLVSQNLFAGGLACAVASAAAGGAFGGPGPFGPVECKNDDQGDGVAPKGSEDPTVNLPPTGKIGTGGITITKDPLEDITYSPKSKKGKRSCKCETLFAYDKGDVWADFSEIATKGYMGTGKDLGPHSEIYDAAGKKKMFIGYRFAIQWKISGDDRSLCEFSQDMKQKTVLDGKTPFTAVDKNKINDFNTATGEGVAGNVRWPKAEAGGPLVADSPGPDNLHPSAWISDYTVTEHCTSVSVDDDGKKTVSKPCTHSWTAHIEVDDDQAGASKVVKDKTKSDLDPTGVKLFPCA